MSTVRLDITRMGQGVIRSIDVRGRSERDIERIIGGLLINMHEECYVAEVDEAEA